MKMRMHNAVLACLVACASLQAMAQVTLDEPRSGWRHAPAEQQDFLQEVHYPAASVNASGKSAAAMIRGRIAGLTKGSDTSARKPRHAADASARRACDRDWRGLRTRTLHTPQPERRSLIGKLHPRGDGAPVIQHLDVDLAQRSGVVEPDRIAEGTAGVA